MTLVVVPEDVHSGVVKRVRDHLEVKAGRIMLDSADSQVLDLVLDFHKSVFELQEHVAAIPSLCLVDNDGNTLATVDVVNKLV